MLLLDDPVLAQALIAFATIAILALVLRWTFGQHEAHTRAASEDEPGGADATDPDDFGLLAPAATVDTVEQADRMRTVLARAGIRATSARGADGRYRVLVFPTELNRARRVGGWSA